MSQINLQDLPATQEYLTQFLGDFNLDQGMIDQVIQNFTQGLGINNIPGLEDADSGDILGQIGSMFGGLFGGD